MDATELLKEVRLMPVVVIEDARKAVALAYSLLEAGIGAIEITLRTECALAAIENIASAVPAILLGAGSVRRPQQFASISSAGAVFAASPGHSDSLLAAAAAQRMPFVPAAATPSECIKLLEHGYRLQKFFPAELLGGVAKIKALSAPLPELRFFPSGGITPANASGYLNCPAVACISGSWFIPEDALNAGDFETIGRLAREAIAIIEA